MARVGEVCSGAADACAAHGGEAREDRQGRETKRRPRLGARTLTAKQGRIIINHLRQSKRLAPFRGRRVRCRAWRASSLACWMATATPTSRMRRIFRESDCGRSFAQRRLRVMGDIYSQLHKSGRIIGSKVDRESCTDKLQLLHRRNSFLLSRNSFPVNRNSFPATGGRVSLLGRNSSPVRYAENAVSQGFRSVRLWVASRHTPIGCCRRI
jgi:hypothetical protein